MIAEGKAKWEVDSVLSDLETTIAQVKDAAKRARLSAIIDKIKAA